MNASSPTSPRSRSPCAEQLDAVLARAARDGLSHQQFLHLLIAEQANQRRERSIAHRIREARFAERKPLSEFDWEFNRSAIDRTQIEELATGGFIGRQENLIMVGQSGVGKSFLIQAIGEAACVLGYSVRYITSADMLQDLTASIADRTLPKRVRYFANFDCLIIDEFGFDHIEREQSPQAANIFFKIIDARNRRCSTALPPTWTSRRGPKTSASYPWPGPSSIALSTAPSSSRSTAGPTAPTALNRPNPDQIQNAKRSIAYTQLSIRPF